MIETLGALKLAMTLKGTISGIAEAIPPLVQNSAMATQRLTVAATPVVSKAVAATQTGITSLNGWITKTVSTFNGTTAGTTKAAGALGAAKAPTGAAVKSFMTPRT